jgi:hypothetical protein
VRKRPPRAVDLIGRGAPKLLEELDALGDAGRAGRVALGLQPAAGVDREPPAVRMSPIAVPAAPSNAAAAPAGGSGETAITSVPGAAAASAVSTGRAPA